MNTGRLRFAYRIIQVALIVSCVLLVLRWRDHQRDTQYAKQSLAKKKELLASAEDVLTGARLQRELVRPELEAARSRLAAAEAREAPVKEK